MPDLTCRGRTALGSPARGRRTCLAPSAITALQPLVVDPMTHPGNSPAGGAW
jgi:hypothetical protein